MTWWLVSLILVVMGVGVLAGLKVSSIYLKRQQRKPLPTFERNFQVGADRQVVAAASVMDTVDSYIKERVPYNPIGTEAASPSQPIPDKVKDYLSERKTKPPAVIQPIIPKSPALEEIEYNLEIANQPLNGKLKAFSTTVWDTRRKEFSTLESDARWQLTQAYLDILLANDIVWLLSELGRDNKNLNESYVKLRIKIEDRLRQVLPSAKTVLK